ncbi:hypothetical protein P175DRAFT_0527597 [Aspergillus ochraceoroseus IBT 24754]|uniref:Uncharacterized protein n=1 Tax=Aspergillus ochraceoroseus IBT 24754 TaxID=1392256 RepID=A0A2T5M6H9_9EURO|nr:uncharacterized protein P175DRAFT_0527597 [Aspergillus ochraceoroseus IBT 24754]PTU24145.1 hypothetical protein P175DRAFT_0527597 [Aspergillus ochraceoroseus IBT 24754]
MPILGNNPEKDGSLRMRRDVLLPVGEAHSGPRAHHVERLDQDTADAQTRHLGAGLCSSPGAQKVLVGSNWLFAHWELSPWGNDVATSCTGSAQRQLPMQIRSTQGFNSSTRDRRGRAMSRLESHSLTQRTSYELQMHNREHGQPRSQPDIPSPQERIGDQIHKGTYSLTTYREPVKLFTATKVLGLRKRMKQDHNASGRLVLDQPGDLRGYTRASLTRPDPILAYSVGTKGIENLWNERNNGLMLISRSSCGLHYITSFLTFYRHRN